MATLKKRKREAVVYDRLIKTIDVTIYDADLRAYLGLSISDWVQFRDGFQAMRRLLHAQGLILTKNGIEKGEPR